MKIAQTITSNESVIDPESNVKFILSKESSYEPLLNHRGRAIVVFKDALDPTLLGILRSRISMIRNVDGCIEMVLRDVSTPAPVFPFIRKVEGLLSNPVKLSKVIVEKTATGFRGILIINDKPCIGEGMITNLASWMWTPLILKPQRYVYTEHEVTVRDPSFVNGELLFSCPQCHYTGKDFYFLGEIDTAILKKFRPAGRQDIENLHWCYDGNTIFKLPKYQFGFDSLVPSIITGVEETLKKYDRGTNFVPYKGGRLNIIYNEDNCRFLWKDETGTEYRVGPSFKFIAGSDEEIPGSLVEMDGEYLVSVVVNGYLFYIMSCSGFF